MAQITRKKLASIAGTRPQLIKHAVLDMELSRRFQVDFLYTGQHYDPSLYKNILSDLSIPYPDVEYSGNADHVVAELSRTLSQEKYDAVLVYGDTNSTLWGAKAAEISSIPLIHIEAGERSYNPQMPEETNRKETDRLAGLRFCVSSKAMDQLEKEGLDSKNFLSGDIMKDLLYIHHPKIIHAPVKGRYYFASMHRNYTRDDKQKMEEILSSLNKLPYKTVFSLHPSTRISMKNAEINLYSYPNIHFINPVNYTDSLAFQKFAEAVLTDSGGIQREAYWLKKKCITLRKETEWTETLPENWNTLYYGDGDLSSLLKLEPGYWNSELYGNGQASQFISDKISMFI